MSTTVCVTTPQILFRLCPPLCHVHHSLCHHTANTLPFVPTNVSCPPHVVSPHPNTLTLVTITVLCPPQFVLPHSKYSSVCASHCVMSTTVCITTPQTLFRLCPPLCHVHHRLCHPNTPAFVPTTVSGPPHFVSPQRKYSSVCAHQCVMSTTCCITTS